VFMRLGKRTVPYIHCGCRRRGQCVLRGVLPAVKVILLSGDVREHPGCKARVDDGVLHVWKERPMGFGSGDTVAHYPLTSIERWEP
jgi:hypothetical protein